MLFGEYLVLDGAMSIAVPLTFGQNLEVRPHESGIQWSSYEQKKKWFECEFDEFLNITKSTDVDTSTYLQRIFQTIQTKSSRELSGRFCIDADFPLDWGIGSSSTLLSLLSDWSGVNAYELSQNSFGGSGYDIACASAKAPISYQLNQGSRVVESVQLSNAVTDHILFVYSGQKQNSRSEIAKYSKKSVSASDVAEMNRIAQSVLQSSNVSEFGRLMQQSESLIGGILGQKPLKETHFKDYTHEIKSLGAWGGDFFLATYENELEAKRYFEKKGYATAFRYNEIVLDT